MITEDYVSFETAKLLKEKEFDEICEYEYGVPNVDKGYVLQRFFKPIKNSELIDDAYTAPTIGMAMKWLREIHHLFIGCEPRLSFTDFYWITTNIYRVRKKSSLYHAEDVDDYHCVASCDSHSYEEACEAAIKYCLEKLI